MKAVEYYNYVWDLFVSLPSFIHPCILPVEKLILAFWTYSKIEKLKLFLYLNNFKQSILPNMSLNVTWSIAIRCFTSLPSAAKLYRKWIHFHDLDLLFFCPMKFFILLFQTKNPGFLFLSIFLKKWDD